MLVLVREQEMEPARELVRERELVLALALALELALVHHMLPVAMPPGLTLN